MVMWMGGERGRDRVAVAAGVVMIAMIVLVVLGELGGWRTADRSDEREERLAECVAAARGYRAEFGWEPEEGVEAWCREMTGIEE